MSTIFQLIFRKVSDLKKEEELAKRRKNDPALNQSQDHIGFSTSQICHQQESSQFYISVRKLFSKFKKIPTSSDMSGVLAHRTDPERGLGSPVRIFSANSGSMILYCINKTVLVLSLTMFYFSMQMYTYVYAVFSFLFVHTHILIFDTHTSASSCQVISRTSSTCSPPLGRQASVTIIVL